MIARQNITLKRVAPGSYDVNGVWVEGAVTSSTIAASVQPASGKELDRLPEGRMYKEAFTLYTSTALNADEDNNADQVTIFGKDFTIVNVEVWRNGILPHYKALAIR